MTKPSNPRWSELLIEAVEQPGLILEAYSRFHGFSLGNQIAALCQCLGRKIQPGPIATLRKWNELGRSVKAGQHAISLCMPVTVTPTTPRKSTPTCKDDDSITIFMWKPRWFVLAQTDGDAEVPPLEIPSWDKATALESLGIQEVAFTHPDGNVQGYAERRTIAISPLAQLPAKTLFHELAHIQLGHVAERGTDRTDLPKNLTEAEAEAVALLCLEALSLPGAEYARGYIQSWYGRGTPIPDPSAQRIFKAANRILRAGELKESRHERAA
ncbi:MAG: hypothetical protein DIJKHBIC_02321 [Thermoanaerobaculia bacterium]|nr:hypothetical protein [Thermoanaerobaculia bacterium]